MESGNSGSMSSSGGEEEYDSRSDSLPTFLNTSMPFGQIAAANSDQAPSSAFLSNDQISSSFLFGAPNSSASFLHMSSHPPHSNPAADNPFLGFDLLRPGGTGGGGSVRSSFNFEDIPGGAPSSSGQTNNNNALAPARGGGGGGGLSSGQNVNPSSPAARDQSSNIPARNPKKRTRASRRAPTTVLTTDTTNFRAMVQEFTGIPAPPFSGSSYSRRLDLFGGSGSGLRSGLESLYPIRPSPQKIQIQPPSSSSSQLNNSSSLPPQNVSVLNMPSTVLTFQSLMQSQGNITMQPPFEGITRHGGLNVSLDMDGLQNRHVATNPHIADRHHHNNNNVYDEHGSNDKYGDSSNSNSNSSSQRVIGNVNCKLNYSAASSGLVNASSRGDQGTTVDTWICPSD